MIRVEKYSQKDNMAENLYGLIKTASVQFIIDEESPKLVAEGAEGRAHQIPDHHKEYHIITRQEDGVPGTHMFNPYRCFIN